MQYKFTILGLGVIIAVAMVGCTSQPAMSSQDVSLLRTGKILLNVPREDVVENMPPPRGVKNTEAMYGAIGVLVVGALSSMANYHKAQAVPYLEPYSNYYNQLHLAAEFKRLCVGVTKHVKWLHSGSSVDIYRKSGGWSEGVMRHRTQTAQVDALAFVQPFVVFSPDMKRLSVVASVRVYARGSSAPAFLSGATVTASTSLQPDKLTSNGSNKGVNAPKHTKRSVQLANRAKAWFANGGARFKSALTADLRLFSQRLTNYFNGRRTS